MVRQLAILTFVALPLLGAERTTLTTEGDRLIVADQQGRVLELVPEPARETSAERALGGHYPLPLGARVATMILERPLADYRGHVIPEGTWQLRYFLQPPLKDHVDTAPHRDFLMLVPSDTLDDASPSALIEASRSGRSHPLVLGIEFPVPVEGPTLLERDDRLVLVLDTAGVRLGILLRGERH